jgi:hypothetical protein
MSRWLFVFCCGLLLVVGSYSERGRSAEARGLAGQCTSDRDCQAGLTCAQVPGVMEGQCSSFCNSSETCEERFGSASMCVGADLCARSCATQAECPEGSTCNAFGWCDAELVD